MNGGVLEAERSNSSRFTVDVVINPGSISLPAAVRYVDQEYNRELSIDELDAPTLAMLKQARDEFDADWAKASASFSFRIAQRETELARQPSLFDDVSAAA